MRRLYETTLIFNAGLEDPEVDAAISKVTSYIENQGGEIKVTDRWGRRRLAYPINKKFNGYYVHIEFELQPSSLPLLERFLVLEDTVLRNLTLQLSVKLRDLRLQKAMEEGSEAAAETVKDQKIAAVNVTENIIEEPVTANDAVDVEEVIDIEEENNIVEEAEKEITAE